MIKIRDILIILLDFQIDRRETNEYILIIQFSFIVSQHWLNIKMGVIIIL
jgi:hypothetical protein